MTSTRKTARLAGLLYVLISLPGFYGLMYVPQRLFVHGDAAATARNILAAPTLFRSGIVANLVGQALFILVGLVLYRLLKGVGKTLAVLMMILLLVQVPIAFLAVVNHLNAIDLLGNAGLASAFGESQRNALMAEYLNAYDNGILVDELFMGLWLFPLGLLIFRSRFLPRFLGVTLFAAGFAWVVESIAWLLLPAYGHAVVKLTSPVRTLELVTPLWMLIAGAKDQPLPD
jgi:hypothetical protein